MGNNHTERQTADQSVREQYQKETGQIHAPADLIRRTKDAVREEERRIARERTAQPASGQRDSGSRTRTGHIYSRVQRWALPAAAAVLVLLVGTSGLFFGRGKGSEESAADTAAQETEAAAEDYDYEIAPSAATEDYNLDEAASGVTTEAEKQTQFERHLQNMEAATAESAETDTAADSGGAAADMAGKKKAAADSAAAVVPALKNVVFYDKDENIVEAEALWYNAARIESILLQWEGGTPSNVKVFRTPAGSETMEQTELLLTQSIADGDESVLLDADVLHDIGTNSHLFFELDFGTQIVKSEEYNLLYDETE